MQEIKLGLTIDEVNLLLEGLGSMPFARVYAVVGKIQEQAGRQIQSATVTAASGAQQEAGAATGKPPSRP